MPQPTSPGARARPVRRLTLADDVYESIKGLVMTHSLPPDERVNIDALARDLDVSPTPVREALARLESDGLVRKRALSGYTTTPLLTRAELDDLFDMRLLLEGEAAARAAAHASSADRQRIATEAAATEGVDAGVEYRRHATFTALDAQFHDLVATAAGSPLLRDSITRLHSHLHLHRLYFPAATAAQTHAEHQRVAAAIVAGEPAAATAAMRAHLTAARERHLPAFDR
ncbi:GntR family transcriptional regulator [Micromonospora mirobrigensis]|uniref:DNA-binding transcriptional regulator, GntR family n=1 Tax=Micromonospora mirobrigensis TaxID=262898 RepID=A0A1C4YZC0_9ACTN|nr:GntR family transcriptional regulator [Micromonospora mirobrigensis]SCF26060.1 DNA-binding transcriptional regulator, GntR family [Micromonospora mirobrigensis]